MPICNRHKKVKTNTMNAYRTPQQYIYHYCQLGHVSPGLSLLVSVCIFMLPMIELADEHAQLTTMYHVNSINQCYIHHMTFTHVPMVLPSFNNVLPAMVLQNKAARLNIGCPSYTSSKSDIHCVSSILHLNLPTGLGKRVVGVMLILLLLLSGDIETNPGPVGQQLTVDDLRVVMKEVYDVRAKWHNIGVQLGVSVGTLKAIEKQYSNDASDCLRESLTTWLKSSTPMWTNIVDALNVVGEVRLAADLEHKYCSTQDIGAPPVPPSPPAQTDSTQSSPPTPVPVQPANLPSDTVPSMTIQPDVAAGLSGAQFQEYLANATIPKCIQTMEMKFDQLLDKVQDGLHEQNISLQRVQRCVTRLPASIKYQHVDFVEEKLKAITHSKNMAEIFGVLNLYWDFLNYTLLEHIVTNFGNNDMKAAMVKYISELVTFRRATNLSDFIFHWPCTGKVPPDMSKLVSKMDKDWSNCTLEDVEQFRRTLTQKLFLPSFTMLLRNAEQGCISLTWLIPSSIVKMLFKDIQNAKLDWFKEHHIESLVVDGQDLYSSARFRYSTFLRNLYRQRPPPTLSSSPLPQKLLSFKLAKLEKEEPNKSPKWYLRGEIDDDGTKYKKSPINFEDVGKLSSHHQQKLILIEGAPGVGKTTFSWEFCRSWSRGEILQDYSLLLLLPLRDNNLKAAKTLSDLFYHPNSELQQAVVQEITSNQGQGVAIWLEAWDELDYELREKTSLFLDLINGRILPFTTVFVTSRPWASEHLRNNYEHRITQHVEVLTSAKDQIDHYISKAEAEAQPSSFAAKFTDYLSSNPAIRAAMYTPITAKMAAEVFTWSQHTESPHPTTMTELFTAFTIKTLVDHLSTHPVYHKQQLKVTTFSDLPTDVYKQFQDLCRMAYEGILNRQQLVFSAAHLPTGFASLGLMKEVHQLYTESGASSYHFIHLTLQEYMAAVHISQLPAHEQVGLFQEHLNSGYFKMTIKFLAGLTKLMNMPPDVTKSLMESDETKLTCFHFLFEAKDILAITESLGLDEIVVRPQYSWTPLDYYVTGHAVSHSNYLWRLYFSHTSIDDENFELFCKGCAALSGTGCKGHIVHANFSENTITSKSIQSFVDISPCIVQMMIDLELHHNKLDASACNLLAKSIPSMSSLRRLWLSNNPIESGGAVEVIKALCGSGVKQLWIWETKIGVPDCEALCELLKSNCSLEELKIYGNDLSSDSVASIITGLSYNNSLTHLNISNSHFGKANAVRLASVLKNHSKCTLTELRLRHSEIISKGAVELMAALSKNTTLKHLDLSHNPIGLEGVTAVAKLLEDHSMSTLTWLELRDCHISGQGAGELAAALCKNSTLKHLNLNFNHIGVEGASSLSEMLQQNTSLQILKLRNESIREEGVHRVIDSLKHNQTLMKLCLPKNFKPENSDHRIEWYG